MIGDKLFLKDLGDSSKEYQYLCIVNNPNEKNKVSSPLPPIALKCCLFFFTGSSTSVNSFRVDLSHINMKDCICVVDMDSTITGRSDLFLGDLIDSSLTIKRMGGETFHFAVFIQNRCALHKLTFEKCHLVTLDFDYLRRNKIDLVAKNLTLQDMKDLVYIESLPNEVETLEISNCPKLKTIITREVSNQIIVDNTMVEIEKLQKHNMACKVLHENPIAFDINHVNNMIAFHNGKITNDPQIIDQILLQDKGLRDIVDNNKRKNVRLSGGLKWFTKKKEGHNYVK